MLDISSLQQLSQLKTSIRSEKDLADGTVRGTQGRFGFVLLDDGREAFLSPDEMAKVLPGDRVEVEVVANPDPKSSKLDGKLEKLLKTEKRTLVGRYIVRGKGHFFAVDMPQLSRWIFIPPKSRGKAKAGDYLLGKIQKHPFEDGKGLARIDSVLGDETVTGIEHVVTRRKFALLDEWTEAEIAEASGIVKQLNETSDLFQGRKDLTSTQFVTIDSESTRDMDDALSIEVVDDGWVLSVAIADPSALIESGSALDKAAEVRANTAYLPGKAVTMLPETLANSAFSLRPNEVRPALVCHLTINSQGVVTSSRFEEALIESKNKLSYDKVAAFLEESNVEAIPESVHEAVTQLLSCSVALNDQRQKNQLLMADQDDYELQLNERQHIETIVRYTRNQAQQVVEEAMLATNNAAGRLLAQYPAGGKGVSQNENDSAVDDGVETIPDTIGIFSAHGGFRPERLEAIKAVVEAELPELAGVDVESPDGYKQVIRALYENPEKHSILAAFRMMLQAGVLTRKPLPHFGLGIDLYATVTSPIRRYNDLHNHRAIKSILTGSPCEGPSQESLKEMQGRVGKTRQASRDLEEWLYCLYLETRKEETFSATITRVTSQGVTVQLNDLGVSGFIKLNPKAYRFDPERMTLTADNETLYIGLSQRVQVERIDLDKKRINFKTVEVAESV